MTPLQEAELGNLDIKEQFDKLDKKIQAKMKDKSAADEVVHLHKEAIDVLDSELYDENGRTLCPRLADKGAFVGDIESDDPDPEGVLDQYIGAELIFETAADGHPRKGTVLKRAKGGDGHTVGRKHNNPVMDTRLYDVDFGGFVTQLTANQIAENMYSQVDEAGRSEMVLKAIVDHRKGPSAVEKANDLITQKNGRKTPKITTGGWDLKIEWAHGSSNWILLSEVKNANPIESAEYAVQVKIDDEPAFAWWVKPILKKRNQIIGIIFPVWGVEWSNVVAFLVCFADNAVILFSTVYLADLEALMLSHSVSKSYSNIQIQTECSHFELNITIYF